MAGGTGDHNLYLWYKRSDMKGFQQFSVVFPSHKVAAAKQTAQELLDCHLVFIEVKITEGRQHVVYRVKK